MNYEQAI